MMTTRLLNGTAPRGFANNLLRHHRIRGFATLPSILPKLLKISPEVEDAIATNKPVVALESTIYTHGALGNDLLSREADIVRANGAIPAVCGILGGVPTVGLTLSEVERMVNEGAKKVSRRDMAYLVGKGLTGTKIHGGTTISGTMILARAAGIRVFGTGGLGGVHRGGENTMDISADLTELGRTRVAVISSGCKGFLDIPRTLEYLETQGVLVSTFADGRTGSIDFPAFWARESGIKSPSVVQDEKEAAAIILAQEQLGIETGMLFPNPIPEEFSISRKDMEAAIDTAVRDADEQGFTGNDNTPFILKRIRELTDGRSVPANRALVEANVKRAAEVAVELAKLLDGKSADKTASITVPVYSKPTPVKKVEKPRAAPVIEEQQKSPNTADILVAGAVALDLSCDFAPLSKDKSVEPSLHTSNPAHITQSVGGVGHNVALAAHRVSPEGQVRLCSMVGDDIAGSTILTSLAASGLDTSCIRKLGHEYPSARTAQYVAVNDRNKNLVTAMADMAIFSTHSFPTYWDSAVAAAKPKWLVVDANWAEQDLQHWIKAGRKHSAKVAFEPVSAAKSERLFPPIKGNKVVGVFPKRPIVDLATPNQYELAAMYAAALRNEYFESATNGWFEIIDAFGIRGGARDKFVRLCGMEATDAGIPVQSVNLLPYIPTIVTKMGSKGALLTQILRPEDERLNDPEEMDFILTRATNGHPHVGGVYMRFFETVEDVPLNDIVSVNAVGDTFLGVLIAGLAQGGRVDKLVDVAQRAAVMTLRSHGGVSAELGEMMAGLREAVDN